MSIDEISDTNLACLGFVLISTVVLVLLPWLLREKRMKHKKQQYRVENLMAFKLYSIM